MSEDEEIARVRQELAQQVSSMATEAVTIASKFGVAIDYTEASLEVLEQLLAQLARSSQTDAQKDNAARLFAAYVLEVGRRAYGGFFQWWEDRGAPVLVVGDPVCRIGLLTLDKVRGRIGGDESDNIPFFYIGFAERARLRQPGDNATYV